jgi:hypothetical protein
VLKAVSRLFDFATVGCFTPLQFCLRNIELFPVGSGQQFCGRTFRALLCQALPGLLIRCLLNVSQHHFVFLIATGFVFTIALRSGSKAGISPLSCSHRLKRYLMVSQHMHRSSFNAVVCSKPKSVRCLTFHIGSCLLVTIDTSIFIVTPSQFCFDPQDLYFVIDYFSFGNRLLFRVRLIMVSTESSEKAIAQHRLLVPRLSLMMFLQFFIWGSWSVTLGLVMTQHNMSLLIGDAFSAGPIASILSPFVLGMLVDRFFASQKVMAVMHLAGAAILWFVPGALIAENGALLIGLLFGYTLCYMPTLALTNNIAFHSLANVDKTFPVVRVFGTIGWIVAGFSSA